MDWAGVEWKSQIYLYPGSMEWVEVSYSDQVSSKSIIYNPFLFYHTTENYFNIQ